MPVEYIGVINNYVSKYSQGRFPQLFQFLRKFSTERSRLNDDDQGIKIARLRTFTTLLFTSINFKFFVKSSMISNGMCDDNINDFHTFHNSLIKLKSEIKPSTVQDVPVTCSCKETIQFSQI